MFFSYFRVVPSFPNHLARPGSLVQRAFWIVSKVRGEPPFPASPMYASAVNLRAGVVAIPLGGARPDRHSPVRVHACARSVRHARGSDAATRAPCRRITRPGGRLSAMLVVSAPARLPAGSRKPCGEVELLGGGRRARATVRRAAQRQGSAAWRCCRAPARPSGREPWPHVVLGGRV